MCSNGSLGCVGGNSAQRTQHRQRLRGQSAVCVCCGQKEDAWIEMHGRDETEVDFTGTLQGLHARLQALGCLPTQTRPLSQASVKRKGVRAGRNLYRSLFHLPLILQWN